MLQGFTRLPLFKNEHMPIKSTKVLRTYDTVPVPCCSSGLLLLLLVALKIGVAQHVLGKRLLQVNLVLLVVLVNPQLLRHKVVSVFLYMCIRGRQAAVEMFRRAYSSSSGNTSKKAQDERAARRLKLPIQSETHTTI